MNNSDFDEYAKNYSNVLKSSIPKYLNEEQYFFEYKIGLISKKLNTKKISKILDFGCGAGLSIPFLRKYFPGA